MQFALKKKVYVSIKLLKLNLLNNINSRTKCQIMGELTFLKMTVKAFP